MIDAALRYGAYFVSVVVALLLTVVLVAFLGGLASAWLEVRRERAAGLIPTRPAWDQRRKRKARGRFSTVKSLWARAQHRGGVELCWCVRGPVQYFDAIDRSDVAGFGCAAWEAGDEVAILRHDAAGGYSRTPDPSVFKSAAA